MKLLNKISYFKALFQHPIIGSAPSSTADEDAKLLSGLGELTVNLKATNGRSYWYYFFADERMDDVISYLFKKNGLAPEFHMSHYNTYYFSLRPSYRIECRHLNANPQFKNFTKSIKPFYPRIKADDARIIQVRLEIAQKQNMR